MHVLNTDIEYDVIENEDTLDDIDERNMKMKTLSRIRREVRHVRCSLPVYHCPNLNRREFSLTILLAALHSPAPEEGGVASSPGPSRKDRRSLGSMLLS